MKCAIDLTQIPNKLAGVGFYMENLIKGLAEIDQINEYQLFIREPILTYFKVDRPNFKYVIIPNYPLAIRVIWEQIVLPIRLLFSGSKVLHSPHYTTPLFGWWFKRVVTFPDMTFFLFPKKHLRFKVIYFWIMIRLSSVIADAIISISHSTTKDISRLLKSDQRKLKTIPLAVARSYRSDISAEQIESVRQHYNLPNKYLLFVGTIEPRKNVKCLVDAYLSLGKTYKDTYKLVLVGRKGWHYEDLFDYLDNHPEKDCIVFTGYVAENDLPAIYNGASLFVYPSFYEGFGIPVLEALACGIPTITANTSSLPEVAGEAALLVDPQRPEDITNAITTVLADPERVKMMVKKGLAQAASFSWEKCARETQAIYLGVE